MQLERDLPVRLGLYMNVVGIFLHLLLFGVVLQLRKNKQILYYSQIVLCASFIDLYFSVEQIFSQHKVQEFKTQSLIRKVQEVKSGLWIFLPGLVTARVIIKSGTIFMIPMGPEVKLLGTNWLSLSFAWHIFGPAGVVCSLPSFFHYRLVIISGEPKFKILAKNMFFSTLATLFNAFAAGLGVYQAQQRGMQSYAQLLNGTSLELRPDQFYAIDLTVPGCLVFILGSTIASNISICLIFYFAYKTWKFLNFFTNQVQSAQTKNLQAQFTRYLIAQTLTGITFAIGPVALISFCMLFRLDFNSPWLLFPLACVPALNVVLTLVMVSTYRKCLLNMCCSMKSWSGSTIINQIMSNGRISNYAT